jgi:hypothetical protein
MEVVEYDVVTVRVVVEDIEAAVVLEDDGTSTEVEDGCTEVEGDWSTSCSSQSPTGAAGSY